MIKTLVSMSLVLFLSIGILETADALDLQLVRQDRGYFSINTPKGWDLHVAGQCAELAFVLRDRNNPLRQIFHFGSIGPVYMSHQQKQIDADYMQMGGYPVPWAEMPVVSPLTPENFLANFELVTSTQIARQFMPQAPKLSSFTLISSTPVSSQISGGQSAVSRALFTEAGVVGEGLFTCTTAPFMQHMGGPGGGNAYAFMVSGVTAPQEEFAGLQPVLAESLSSFVVSSQYVQQCMAASQGAFEQVIQAGQTLRETSDMIVDGWRDRNRTYDVIAQKRSDAMLGYSRVYNPDDDEIYRVDPAFWDQYDKNRHLYDMGNLEMLSGNDYEQWTRVPRNQTEIR